MTTARGSLDLPRRRSLSSQAAEAIRKGIARNAWPEYLPSERRLCDLLQVSRPTVRTALQFLAKERVIAIQQGRRNRILARPSPRSHPQSRLVVLVSHAPITHTTLTAYQGISEMRAHLAEHGFSTEVLVCGGRSPSAHRRRLETFVRQNHVFCCVLLSVSREVQEWFATHSMPALVLGSCHPEVQLPSLDMDYRAVCRHAAGFLRSRGHRRIAFVVPDSGVAGDLVSEQGFREGCTPSPGSSDVPGLVVRHNGTRGHLTGRLDALFSAASPPTALLIAKPVHTFAVLMYLLKRGRRVPDTVSIIARDDDPLFDDGLSHYACRGESFAHRLSRLMLQMVGQGYLPAEPTLIFPRLVLGETVRTLPSRP